MNGTIPIAEMTKEERIQAAILYKVSWRQNTGSTPHLRDELMADVHRLLDRFGYEVMPEDIYQQIDRMLAGG